MRKLPFDVFVSYHSEDHILAQEIANELKSVGLNVWFDKWGIKPGETWPERLDAAIRESSSIIVLIGPSGIGPWEEEEVRSALQTQKKQGCPLIPVILPGAKGSRLPPFLDQRELVDCCTQGISYKSLDRLVWGITGKRLSRSISQMGDEFGLRLKMPCRSERTIKVYPLTNPDTGNLLDITWETLGKGIEKLQEQIKNYGHHLNVDACFGINDAGLVIATFLNSSVLDRVKLGYIRCKGGAEGSVISDDSFFPELPEKPTVILVDFEVKSGNAIGTVVQRMLGEYSEPKIYFAVFGAMTGNGDLKISDFDELVSAKNILSAGIRDIFIACMMHYPGIEPPLRLR